MSTVLRVILLHEIIYLLQMIIRNSTHFKISGSYIMLLGAYVPKYNYFEKNHKFMQSVSTLHKTRNDNLDAPSHVGACKVSPPYTQL